MSKHNEGFIIDPTGRVTLWVELTKRTGDGFYFFVRNGAWKGRWADTDDLLTNGVFKVSDFKTRDDWRPASFRYTPPAMPYFGTTQYNDAINWMQTYIDNGERA